MLAKKKNVCTPVIGKGLSLTTNVKSLSCRFHGNVYFAGIYTDGSSMFVIVPSEG
jgi:hypothetical protein